MISLLNFLKAQRLTTFCLLTLQTFWKSGPERPAANLVAAFALCNKTSSENCGRTRAQSECVNDGELFCYLINRRAASCDTGCSDNLDRVATLTLAFCLRNARSHGWLQIDRCFISRPQPTIHPSAECVHQTQVYRNLRTQ